MASIQRQIMDALAAVLTTPALPGVSTVVLDSGRIVAEPDGVAVTLDYDGPSNPDQISRTCQVDSELPVLITIYRTRTPNESPAWQLLDPFYVEIHARVMADRTLGGLALDLRSVSRVADADPKMVALGCRYSVMYRTRQEAVDSQ